MRENGGATDTRSVSVIMGVYKESVAAVAATLENLWSQTRPPEQVVVVLDDPDNTAVREYLETTAATEPRLTVAYHEENRGLGAALNTAVQHARGDLLARADVEDRSEPERLARQLAHLAEYPETDLLFTQWTEHYEDGTERLRAPRRADVQRIRKYFFTKSILLHPTLLIKKAVLEKHPYPEIARPEDFVLFLDLIHHGYRFDLVEAPLYHYTVDRTQRYQKVRTYSRTMWPQLVRRYRYYWHNLYYYLYLLRITGEYLVSRNETIFNLTHRTAARLWKTLSG